MYLRISRGHFDPDAHGAVEDALRAAEASLIPAIRHLSGVVSYYAGIDAESSTMVNVSVWRSLAQAQQMSTLREMTELRVHFEASGVRIDPIVNYQVLWNL